MPRFIIEARVCVEAKDLADAQLVADALSDHLCDPEEVVEVLRCRVDTSAGEDETCSPTHGWIHMLDPYEVQRDDEAGIFEDDDAARAAHAKDCGCAWGTMDLSEVLSWARVQTPPRNDLATFIDNLLANGASEEG
jgi:5,10-methenyltetrahydromethanopterin hydrogenase